MTSEQITNLPVGTIVLEPQSQFNSAIVGFDDQSGRLIYEYEKIITALQGDRTLTEELYWEIVSHIDCNILGMIEPGWPLIKEEDQFLNGDYNEQK